MDTITITNPLDKTAFTYGKVGYPSIVVFDPSGKEVGRKLFQSWLRQENVTDAEAQEEAIQAIEKIISGKCKICEDPVAGVPPTDKAQTYDGWAVGPDGIVGTVTFKLAKANRDGVVKVSGSAKIGSRTVRFSSVSRNNTPKHFLNLIKKRGALVAKGRLLGVQFDALFSNDLYNRIGQHASEMAEQIKALFKEKGYRFFLDSPTNQQFIILENSKIKELEKEVVMGFWEEYDADHTVMRFATSWSTTQEDIEALRKLL